MIRGYADAQKKTKTVKVCAYAGFLTKMMNDTFLYMLGLITFVASAFAVALVMVLLLPVGILICLAELIIKKGKFKDL